MQGLPDNLDQKETPERAMSTCLNHPRVPDAQCPRALAWMASLALAAGDRAGAEGWLVEVIGALLFRAYDVPGLTPPGESAARTGIERRS